ncbi:MAG: caspase family protein [Planctomycetota bacterium]|nr:caspase family protein [Planctomycetota bacterium]
MTGAGLSTRQGLLGLAVALVLLLAPAAAAERGFVPLRRQASDHIALVIGNAAYPDAPLANPVYDAQAVSRALEGIGFVVTQVLDADLEEMTIAIQRFGERLRSAKVALFYFAGHGVQVNGENWLLPIARRPEARIDSEEQVPYRAVAVGELLGRMEKARVPVNIVILDACRNNPFRGRTRARVQGLAEIKAPLGTLVIYATAPGSVAADSAGRHSPFTQALLEYLQRPGLDVRLMVTEVNKRVHALTGGAQTPWVSMSLLEGFCFVPALTVEEEAALKQQELSRLLGLEQQEARERERRQQEEAELERRRAEIARLDQEIAAVQQRLQRRGSPDLGSAKADESMAQLLELSRQRKQEQQELKRRQQQLAEERRQRELELWRQRVAAYEQERERWRERRQLLQADLETYREIVANDRSLAETAWQVLLRKWEVSGAEIGDAFLLLQRALPEPKPPSLPPWVAEAFERERQEREARRRAWLSVLQGTVSIEDIAQPARAPARAGAGRAADAPRDAGRADPRAPAPP